MALRDHFTVDDKAAIGYLNYSPESRKDLAQKSKNWKCKLCPYDASKYFEGSNEPETAVETEKKPDEFNLFWIGLLLLLLSLITSYFYLYLT